MSDLNQSNQEKDNELSDRQLNEVIYRTNLKIEKHLESISNNVKFFFWMFIASLIILFIIVANTKV